MNCLHSGVGPDHRVCRGQVPPHRLPLHRRCAAEVDLLPVWCTVNLRYRWQLAIIELMGARLVGLLLGPVVVWLGREDYSLRCRIAGLVPAPGGAVYRSVEYGFPPSSPPPGASNAIAPPFLGWGHSSARVRWCLHLAPVPKSISGPVHCLLRVLLGLFQLDCSLNLQIPLSSPCFSSLAPPWPPSLAACGFHRSFFSRWCSVGLPGPPSSPCQRPQLLKCLMQDVEPSSSCRALRRLFAPLLPVPTGI